MVMMTLICVLVSFVGGMLTAFVIDDRIFPRKPRPHPANEGFKAMTERFRLPWQPLKPAPKRPELAAIPRSPGSWRRQKARLERKHNSNQIGPQFRAL